MGIGRGVLCLLSTIFLISRAKGDVLFPLTFPFVPYIPLIISVEIAAFFLIQKTVRLNVSFLKGIAAVVLANVLSSTAGIIVPGPYNVEIHVWIAAGYVLSALIEAAVYRITLNVSFIQCLIISAILNGASYITVTVMIVL